MNTKVLDDHQLESFNTSNRPLPDCMAKTVNKCIDRDFEDEEFSFLDIGGGVGRLTDAILARYPKSHGTIMDNSQYLLNFNSTHSRKTVQLASACSLEETYEGKRFDVIFFHDVLHHLVCNTYRNSLRAISGALEAAAELLSVRGRVSIWENVYSGGVVDSGPSRIIYHLTASRVLRPIAHSLGANTAGVGVCFLSEKQWYTLLQQAKLEILEYSEVTSMTPPSLMKRVLLHIDNAVGGHFWCSHG